MFCYSNIFRTEQKKTLHLHANWVNSKKTWHSILYTQEKKLRFFGILVDFFNTNFDIYKREIKEKNIFMNFYERYRIWFPV